MNKRILKSLVTFALIFVIYLIEWGCIVASASGLDGVDPWLGLPARTLVALGHSLSA
jgi:hypothetical protein